MTVTETVDPAEVGEVMGKLMGDLAGTIGLQATHLGIRVGLWKALAGAGPQTPAEVSTTSGVPEPYVREWLKLQVASGYVAHEEGTDRFELPSAVAAVLGDDEQARMVEGFAEMLAAMVLDAPALEAAYRGGGGVGWDRRRPGHWHGMDLVTRAAVVPVLVSQWIPSLGDVEARLRAGGTVADVGCGLGAVLVALAQAYPAARGTGFDYHDASIAQARGAAASAGVADRVAFEVADAASFPGSGYDLVLFVDTLHDLGDPEQALRRARHALAPDGAVLLVEFDASDRLEDNCTPFGRLLYGSSALVCTPNAVSQGAVEPLGTAAGETALGAVAARAGFSRVRRVPVDAGINLVLELRP